MQGGIEVMSNVILWLQENYVMIAGTIFAGYMIRIFYECKNFKSVTKEDFHQFLKRQGLKVLCAIVVFVIIVIIMKAIFHW